MRCRHVDGTYDRQDRRRAIGTTPGLTNATAVTTHASNASHLQQGITRCSTGLLYTDCAVALQKYFYTKARICLLYTKCHHAWTPSTTSYYCKLAKHVHTLSVLLLLRDCAFGAVQQSCLTDSTRSHTPRLTLKTSFSIPSHHPPLIIRTAIPDLAILLDRLSRPHRLHDSFPDRSHAYGPSSWI